MIPIVIHKRLDLGLISLCVISIYWKKKQFKNELVIFNSISLRQQYVMESINVSIFSFSVGETRRKPPQHDGDNADQRGGVFRRVG